MTRGALAAAFGLLLTLLLFVTAMPGGIAAQDLPALPPWNVECVDCPPGIDAMGDHALRLDADGHPHIAFGGEHLYYAHHDGAAWHIEVVDPARWVGGGASLAFDDAGAPHVVYDAPGEHQVRYAWHDGASWQIEVVDGAVRYGGGRPSLAFDAAGRPRASYYDWYEGRLKYAWREAATWHDGAAWHAELVAATPFPGVTSLAIDPVGVPRIAYSYHTVWGDRLLYARRQSSLFYVAKDAAPRDGVASGDVITYTLALYGPGVEAALWDPLPANVEYVSGTLTAPAEYSPTARAVVWHGVLPTGTAQVIEFRVTAAFSGTAPVAIANTAWLTDVQAGRVSRGTVVVNGFRAYVPVVARDYWYDW